MTTVNDLIETPGVRTSLVTCAISCGSTFMACTRGLMVLYSRVFQRLQIALVLRTRAILMVFEKLNRACSYQIALKTIRLPTYTYQRS
jgi:hypothetical protein